MRAASSLPLPDSPQMCTGAWLRARRSIIARARRIGSLSPASVVAPSGALAAASPAGCDSRSAARTTVRNWATWSGLVT